MTLNQETLPGKASLVVNDNTTPVMLPARREPIATRDRLKSELTQLVNLGIITPVEEPTDAGEEIWKVAYLPRPETFE